MANYIFAERYEEIKKRINLYKENPFKYSRTEIKEIIEYSVERNRITLTEASILLDILSQ